MEDVSVTISPGVEQVSSPNDFSDFMRGLDQGLNNTSKPVGFPETRANLEAPALNMRTETVQRSAGLNRASMAQAERVSHLPSQGAGSTSRLDALATVAEANGGDPVPCPQVGMADSQYERAPTSTSASQPDALAKRELILRLLLSSAPEEAIEKVTDVLSGRSVSPGKAVQSQPSLNQPSTTHSRIQEHSSKRAALVSYEDSNIDPALQSAHSPSLHNKGKQLTPKDIKQCRDCKKTVSRNSELKYVIPSLQHLLNDTPDTSLQ